MYLSSPIALALLLCAAPAWAINKCPKPDGTVVFQDAPCEAKSAPNRDDLAELRKASRAKQPAPENDADFVRRANAEIAADSRQITADKRRVQAEVDRICKGKVYERPLVGMSEAMVLNCLDTGQPTLVHETQTSASVTRQYAYERAATGVRYLYTRNGVVTVVTR